MRRIGQEVIFNRGDKYDLYYCAPAQISISPAMRWVRILRTMVRMTGAVANSACLWGDAALHMTMAHETSRTTGGSKRSMAVSGPEWRMAMDPMPIRDMGVDVCHSHTRIAMRCPIGYNHART